MSPARRWAVARLAALAFAELGAARSWAVATLVALASAELGAPLDQGHGLLATSFERMSELLGSKYRAVALWAVLREGRDPTSQLEAPELGKATRALAIERGGLPARLVSMSAPAADGTTKLLIELTGRPAATAAAPTAATKRELVEAVLIPQPDRASKPSTTLCISTQVGCAQARRFRNDEPPQSPPSPSSWSQLSGVPTDRHPNWQACRFCATGAMGLLRDLTADEIAAQYWVGLRAVSASQFWAPTLTLVVRSPP